MNSRVSEEAQQGAGLQQVRAIADVVSVIDLFADERQLGFAELELYDDVEPTLIESSSALPGNGAPW